MVQPGHNGLTAVAKEPGRPREFGTTESLYRMLRDALWNVEIVSVLWEAKALTERRLKRHPKLRPHIFRSRQRRAPEPSSRPQLHGGSSRTGHPSHRVRRPQETGPQQWALANTVRICWRLSIMPDSARISVGSALCRTRSPPDQAQRCTWRSWSSEPERRSGRVA